MGISCPLFSVNCLLCCYVEILKALGKVKSSEKYSVVKTWKCCIGPDGILSILFTKPISDDIGFLEPYMYIYNTVKDILRVVNWAVMGFVSRVSKNENCA